jgi:hypothetical protein
MITHSASHIFSCYLLVAFAFLRDARVRFSFKYVGLFFFHPSHMTFPAARQKRLDSHPLASLIQTTKRKTSHRHMRFEKLDQKCLYLSLHSPSLTTLPHSLIPQMNIKISHTNSEAFSMAKANFPIDNIFCLLLLSPLALSPF